MEGKNQKQAQRKKPALWIPLLLSVLLVLLVVMAMLFQTDGGRDRDASSAEEASAEAPAARYTDVLITDEGELFAIREDGTVATNSEDSDLRAAVSSWEEVTQLASISRALFALHQDGTVSYALRTAEWWDNSVDPFESARDWEGITSIAAWNYQVLGLREDGTILHAGDEEWAAMLPADLSEWSGLKELHAVQNDMGGYLLGLREDGTPLPAERSEEQSSWFYWTGDPESIASLSCGDYLWMALKEDGTALCGGLDAWIIAEEDEVAGWRDLVQVAAGGSRAAGLKKDGTVVTAGFKLENPEEWSDVGSLQMDRAGNLYGIREDGTVLCSVREQASYPVDTEEISTWTDVQQLFFNRTGQILALRRDGSLVGSGSEELLYGSILER